MRVCSAVTVAVAALFVALSACGRDVEACEDGRGDGLETISPRDVDEMAARGGRAAHHSVRRVLHPGERACTFVRAR